MKMKEESEKHGLKLNIQKTSLVASGPIPSWQIDGENGNSDRLSSWTPKSLWMTTVARKFRHLLLGRKAMTSLVLQLFSCVQLWDCLDYNTPGFPVLQHLLELAQMRVHRGGDAIQPLSSVIPFSSWLKSFPASGSFLQTQLFARGGQSIGASDTASVLPINIQDWFPLGLTHLISLQSNGLLRVFPNTTVQKHQFFRSQTSLWSNSHIHNGYFWQSNVFAI